jgi:hypothetical protein
VTTSFLHQAQLSVMRAITAEVNMRQIGVRVYHDGLSSDELWDDFDAAMTCVLADFPAEGPEAISLHHSLRRYDPPDPIPAIGWPIFARKGTRFRE